MTAARIAVTDLEVRYGDRTALAGVSFVVAPGTVVGMLGPNGSGKSTVLAALAGMAVVSRGTLAVDGRTVPFGDRAWRARTGMVFQSPALDPKLNARDNLDLAARLHGVRDRSRTDAMLAFADLADRAREPVERLSGGMKRRLDLARAVLPRPAVLLLDEPSTGLDEPSFQRLWSALAELRHSEGLTVLVASHRADEAEKCDRLVVIDHGRVIADETPGELRARVSGDVITLATHDPEGISTRLNTVLDAGARVVAGTVRIEKARGHEWIPRIVEAVPPGALVSVSMRGPSLAEAFVHLTGRGLDVDNAAPRLNGATARSARPA